MQSFGQLVSITFQGVVVVFGRPLGAATTDIYFNVLGQDVDVDDDARNWAGFTRLDFTRQVRQVGMSLVTLQRDADTIVASAEPFRVVTDQKYISIIQQSERGTLFVNRFRLIKATSGTDQKVTTYSLNPVWEVRFSRSGNEDVPADKSDKQDYLDPDGAPFLEPALELSMIDEVSGGDFDVVLLPVSNKDSFAWQFLTRDGPRIRLFNFPADANGLFETAGKPVAEDYRILPDSVFTLRQQGADDDLPLQGAPRATTYVKHEKIVQPDGTSIGVKRATRVMLVLPLVEDEAPLVATLDTAVSPAGRMALLDGPIEATAIVPAEFDLIFNGVAALELAAPGGDVDPRSITGPYALRVMVNPAAKGDGVVLIGGDPAADPATAAPYLAIVEGDRLEVGFGTGDAAVSARTLHQVLITGTWSDVELVYAGPGDNPFTLRLNGSAVPLSECSAPANPGGAPLTRIGGGNPGFEGALNRVAVLAGDTPLLDLPCNQIDYAATPPTTPNAADWGIVAQVAGAKLEPSTSPVDSPMSGAFHIDPAGLTYYAGIAPFIAPASDCCLIEGSDGLLHLYYQGANGDLTVAQFNVEAARAGFAVGWSTDWQATEAHAAPRDGAPRYHGRPHQDWCAVAPGLMQARGGSAEQPQAGFLNFVSQRVGTYMNPTRITVSPSPASPLFCDIAVSAPGDVGTETWRGLPRDIAQLERIWNGAGSSNPDDKEVQSRARPYYDYQGRSAAVAVAAQGGPEGAFFLVTSVPGLPLALAALTVEAGSTEDYVTLTAETAAPPNWDSTEALRQVWADVPARAQRLIETFAGQNTRYDPGAVTTPGSRAFGLRVAITRSDEQVAHVTLFVRNALKDFAITIKDGSQPRLCKVEINGTLLTDVPRRQDRFCAVLNGSDPDYPYPEGYRTGLAKQIYALDNGLAAEVVNAAAAEPGGALAYAGLLRVLFQGSGFAESRIGTRARTQAAAFQSATAGFDGTESRIHGARLFGAVTETRPSNGGVGRLADTDTMSQQQAALRTPGVNGGWTPAIPGFALTMNAASKSNYVGFDVDKAFLPAESLAILSDLTVEAWINQDEIRAAPLERALSYNVTGNLDHPDEPIQWMIGARQGPALNLGPNTFIRRSFNFAPPAMSLQVYLRLPEPIVAGEVLSVTEVNGSTVYMALSVDQLGTVTLDFLSGAGKLVSSSKIAPGRWTCVTAVIGAGASADQVALSLAIDDRDPVTGTAASGFTGKLGSLMLGSQTGKGFTGSANGVAFWQRALSAQEVKNSYLHGFPDTDPMLGIRWNLAEGSGTLVANSAASGAEYDASVTNPASTGWDAQGAFKVPFAGRNALVLASNRILKGWTHVALSSRQGRGLAFNGTASGTLADADSFNPTDALALEIWVRPDAANQKQVLLEKPGSYSLSINSSGQICLKVELQQDPLTYQDPPVTFSYEVKTAIPAGQTSYVTVDFRTGSVPDDTGSTGFVAQKYQVLASVRVNGGEPVRNDKKDYTRAVQIRSQSSKLYLGMAESGTFRYSGLLSHLRVWNRTLTAPEIAATWQFRSIPANVDGLVAAWDFEETSGKTATDTSGSYLFELSSNQLWTLWQDVAQAEIVVNGRPSLPMRLQPADVGDYGDAQFTLGASLEDGAPTLGLRGRIDDVRLFNVRLTAQQIREAMNRPLSGGEDHLAGYWPIEAGSGPTVYDMTGVGNNGTRLPEASPPAWTAESAPLQNEAQYVVNTLGGRRDYYTAAIDGAPSVVEYAGAERDAYGQLFSVQKRGYFYHAATGETALQVGYKVGDLDTIFVGQVQSKPTIVGYVEGGPPIPSENQTLAFWVGDNGGPARFYAGISTVTYAETETTTWSFSAAKSSTFNGGLNVKGGYYFEAKVGTSVGVGAEAEADVAKAKGKIGLKSTLSGDLGSTDQLSQSHSSAVSLSTTMTPAGTWEPEDDILNPVVGRRFIPNNVGIALVKSATADLFMLALKGTQTPVGYVLAPNRNIPVDTNIIDFPINPRYVKNGTLDGKVGLVNDPDYPEADLERGSYFKPVEAYATRQRIEKQEQQLKAYYDQFDVEKYRLLASYDKVVDQLAKNAAYDFANKRNLRSLFNNYVWTAAGGMHREEHSVANSYSETYTGASSLKFAAGAFLDIAVGTPAGGYFVEADFMLGNTWTMTATKSESSQNGFRLACNVNPTEFLPAPKLSYDKDGKLVFEGYAKDPAPGKVDAYRYASFLIAPEEANFTALSKVVDQNWLNNSTTAAAAAMREALANPAEPWRILYRTTFVSRVPAPFQPVKDDTDAPNITPPANLASNSWLTGILDAEIGTPTPTRLEIGAAIDRLLGSSAEASGILGTLVPWWPDFLRAAATYGSDEFRELAVLRSEMLTYMVSKYQAAAYDAA